MDVPVLMKLNNYGTVRYRPQSEIDESQEIREYPHESKDKLQNKEGYFFHANLKDYSKSEF